jgi:hypothetical protein
MADGWETGRNQSITPCLVSKCLGKHIKKEENVISVPESTKA